MKKVSSGLRVLLKDLKIAQEMAHQAGLDLPITAELISLYEKSQQAGFGEQDMAALYSYVQAAQRKIQA